MSGKLTTVRRFAGAAGTSREEGGFAVSPDAYRVVAAINPGGPWVMVSLRTNNVGEPFERPGGERLLTWTDDGHLIFGEYDASTQIYTVRATTLRGTGARLLYRIRLGWDPRNQPVLVARDILVNR
jgi:hypothetical protein